MRHLDRIDVHDQGARRGPALDGENPGHGGRVKRIGAQPVDCLRGKSDQPALADQGGRALYVHSGVSSLSSPAVLPVLRQTS